MSQLVKRSRIIVAAVAGSLVFGATIWVWRQRADLFGSSQRTATHQRGATKSESASAEEPGSQFPLLLKDPIRALLELNGQQQEDGDTVVQAPIDDALAPPVEPSIFNVDTVALGPRADQIVVDPSMLDPAREEELTYSDSKDLAPTTAINAPSEDTAHNEQILQGKATTEDLSIGPKEVDPNTHPPTD